jgi:hypothetical protein
MACYEYESVEVKQGHLEKQFVKRVCKQAIWMSQMLVVMVPNQWSLARCLR